MQDVAARDLTLNLISGPSLGSASVTNTGGGGAAEVDYELGGWSTGTEDSFTYSVTENDSPYETSNTATATITILQDTPVASAATYQAAENHTIPDSLSGSDPGGLSISYSVVDGLH